MNEEKEERRGFRVTDRRRFSESGEAREDEASQASPAPVESPPAAPAASPPPVEDAAEEPVSFSTFVLGLSTQALLHLGEIPNPSTHALEPDLEAAKHVIDILGILEQKTRGNLEPGEESLLGSVLYDLRLRYVDLVRRSVKEGT